VKGILLKQAIKHYNERRGTKPKLKQKDIGKVWFPTLSEKTIEAYMSQISNGKKQNLITKIRVQQLCKLTGVDANFLFEISNNEFRE